MVAVPPISTLIVLGPESIGTISPGLSSFAMKNDNRSSHWFTRLSKVLEDELNVQLHIGRKTAWASFPIDVKSEIESANGRL